MKGFIRIIILAQMISISSSQIVFSLTNRPSPSFNSVSKNKYTEYFNQGENFKLQGNYEKSIELFMKALSLAQENDDKKSEVESLLRLGLLYWNIGQLDESIDIYNKTLAICKKLESSEKSEEILNYLQIHKFYKSGKDYRLKGRHQKSIEEFKKAVALARKIKSKEHEVKCLRQLSVTYSEINDIDSLFSFSKKALEIARKLKHGKEEGRCLYNIGHYYDAIEDYSQALWHYEEARKIARNTEDYDDESCCLTNISRIYIHLGKYERALEYLREVLIIDRHLKEDEYVAIDLNNIGVTYQKKAFQSNNTEDLHNALKNFRESLRIAKKIGDVKTEIQVLANIGMVFIDLESYPEALRCFRLGLEKAEKIQDSEEIANFYINMGIVHSEQESFDLTIQYCQKAIDTASEIELLWEAYLEQANAYMKQNNYQKSLESYKKSIEHLEKIRSTIRLEELKARYLGTDKRIDTYYNVIDLLVKFNQSEPGRRHDVEAFRYVERAKARAFLDRLEVSQVNISTGVNIELLNREDELMKEISKLNAEFLTPGLSLKEKKKIDGQIKHLEEELEALKREIRISSPAYANLKYPQIISLEQTQKQMLDNKTAFFEYSIGKKNSYAFVITKKRLKIFPLSSAEKIQTEVKDYLSTINDKDNHDFRIGYELFRTLVLPGLDDGIEKLIFIPDDILHYLPFETLISRKDKKRWLIEDYRIAYAPSISSLREIIQHDKLSDKKPQEDIIAFGDPSFGFNEEEERTGAALKNISPARSFDFPRLKYSGLEIERIAALFKKAKIEIFKRKEATEEKFKKLNLADYKILHFATHCLVDDKNPARSSIVFSLGNNSDEDGFLQMREIFNLRLNSDLVTLSACQTGLGQFIIGEGIEGLSRAFFYAGACSVLISLWAVHDQASSQFMERYYIHLRSSNSIMDSLQKTKLEMIGSDALSHPYYWAAFIATGNSDKIIYPSTKKKLIFIISLLFLSGAISFLIILKKRFKSSSAAS